jgi:hypothetical protein
MYWEAQRGLKSFDKSFIGCLKTDEKIAAKDLPKLVEKLPKPAFDSSFCTREREMRFLGNRSDFPLLIVLTSRRVIGWCFRFPKNTLVYVPSEKILGAGADSFASCITYN